MTLFKKISRFFSASRRSENARRQKEIDDRIELASIRRQAMTIRRQADQFRLEAISLEKGGDHARAVAKAATAANLEKTYETAVKQITNIERIIAQTKTTVAMKELLESINRMTESAITAGNVDDVIQAQAKLQQNEERLKVIQASMDDLQEGFDQDTDPAQRNEAGEEALRRIMQEQETEEKEQAIAEPAQATALPEPEKDKEKAAHTEWVNERRKQLNELNEMPC